MKNASLWRDAAELPDDESEYHPYPEIRRCESDCPHFDLINQCCWLMTANTGLMTNVQEFDECFHGIKEDS